MPTPLYLWIENDQGEELPGEVTIRGRNGSVEILELEHDISLPIDRDTGTVTGTRKHGMMTLTKAVDQISPYFYEAVNRGKSLSAATLIFYRQTSQGAEEEYFRIRMDDVKIAKVHAIVPNVKQVEMERYPHTEKVSLLYKKITWTFKNGNISHTDTWEDRGDA